MPLFKTRRLTSLAQLPGILKKITSSGKKTLWYRGHRQVSWKLNPTILRSGSSSRSELALIKRFKQNAYSILRPAPDEGNEWEWLFLMRHHGAPTRLLDWSESPLVALFFAVTGAAKSGSRLWCLDPVKLNTAAQVQPGTAGELPYFGIDEDLKVYSTEKVHNATTTKLPAAGLAPRFFPRVAAQAGVFTIVHRDKVPLERSSKTQASVGAIDIPQSARAVIALELRMMGVNQLSLFPELDSVAKQAMDATK